jgi:hypothetical protein
LIRVTLAPEPPDFDVKVRQPGLLAIAEMTGQMPTHPRKSGKAFKQHFIRSADEGVSELRRQSRLRDGEV